jgi:hypothetical protein
MNNICVFSDSKSENYKMFYGGSTSGRTVEAKIERIDVKSRDQLIANAMLRAPKDSYILCAYGPLQTTMSKKDIFDALEEVIEKIVDFDVFYLTIYSDDCPLRTDIYDYKDMSFERTLSPHGTECILISPQGASKILNTIKGNEGRGFDFYLNAAAEKMMLYTSSPPMIMVDNSKRSKDTELIKSSVCREVITAQNPLKLTQAYNGNMNLCWFFIIIVFILFIAAMVLSFDKDLKSESPRSNRRDAEHVGKQNAAELLSPYSH